MNTELTEFAAKQLSLSWSAFRSDFLLLLPFAAIIIVGVYLWTSRRGSRSWDGFLEFLLPSRFRSAKTIKMDLVSATTMFILIVPIAHLIGLSGEMIEHALSLLVGTTPATALEPWAAITIQMAAALFAIEFGSWGGHYVHHKVPFLWELHKVHHSSEAMVGVSGLRFHPVEQLLTVPLLALVPGVALGVALYFTGGHLYPFVVSALVVRGTINQTMDFLYHSHISIPFGRFSRIIASPEMHQLHHSAEPQHRDKNFSWFALLDWTFGTLYIPKKGEEFRIGISDSERGERNPHLTFRGFFLDPIIGFASGLFASIFRRRSADAVTVAVKTGVQN